MADEIVYLRMRQRRDYAANWVATNDVLLEGEFGVELDTGRLKIGDGSTPWLDLTYVNLGQISTDGLVDGSTLKWDATAEQWVMVAPSTVDLTIGVIGGVFDGGGTDIPVGTECEVYVPYGFEIIEWRTLALSGVVGAWEVDARACVYTAYPPGAGNSIAGASTPIAIAAGNDKASSAVLTGWTTAFAAGQIIRFTVTDCDGVSKANVELIVRKV